eukprot:6155344-Pleurochrysis_carterae.AAC.1
MRACNHILGMLLSFSIAERPWPECACVGEPFQALSRGILPVCPQFRCGLLKCYWTSTSTLTENLRLQLFSWFAPSSNAFSEHAFTHGAYAHLHVNPLDAQVRNAAHAAMARIAPKAGEQARQ